ncbi:hypothetical protein EBB07_14710 [Paenibacillaceae bacterium]|nr:hypothetical protein EBB07_14710 [Paenibacillaceae bacterium]
MSTWFKVVWVLAIIINIVALVWFILGSTANFQRSLDLVERLTLIVYGLTSFALTSLSILMLIKQTGKSSVSLYTLGSVIILLLVYLSQPLFETVRTEGWLHESVQSDPIKVTSDGRYEYHIELVNFEQRNRSERLILTNILTGEVNKITIDIDTSGSNGLARGRSNWGWAIMHPTESPNKYNLVTTEYLKMPEKVFLIDVEKGISEKLD